MKYLFSLALLLFFHSGLNAQYNPRFDTLWYSISVKSQIDRLLIDSDHISYNIARRDNMNVSANLPITARTLDGEFKWKSFPGANNIYKDLLGFDIYKNLYVSVAEGASQTFLRKLSHDYGTTTVNVNMIYFNKIVTPIQVITLPENDFIVAGKVNAGLSSPGECFVGKYTSMGEMVWVRFFAENSFDMVKMEMLNDKIYVLTSGKNANSVLNYSDHFFGFNTSDGTPVFDFLVDPGNPNCHTKDFYIHQNKIAFIYIRDLSNADYNCLATLDTLGQQMNLLDMSMVQNQNLWYNKMALDSDQHIFVHGGGNEAAQGFTMKFNTNGTQMDSVADPILQNPNKLHPLIFRIHNDKIYIAGAKYITSTKFEKILHVYDKNLNLIDEKTDLNPSISNYKDFWTHFDINDYGCYILGGIEQSNPGFENAKLSKFCIDVAENETIEADLPEISIYPNPASGKITIQSNTLLNNDFLAIYSASGQKVWQQTIDPANNSFTTDISSLQKGIYFIEFGNTKTKLVIE